MLVFLFKTIKVENYKKNVVFYLPSKKSFEFVKFHSEYSSENACDFEEIRKYILGFFFWY